MLISTVLLTLAAAAADTRGPLFTSKDYPREARKNREEGTVHTRLTIGADGRVKACEVIGTSNSRSLDHATCEVMRTRARFIPAMDKDGKPIKAVFTPPPIAWRL